MAVANVKDLTELRPVIVQVGGTSIGVVLLKGRYFAYRNSCPHQGGPAMEGDPVGNTEVEIAPDGRSRREYLSGERFNVSCPWHGVEFDLETGICHADKRMRLRRYELLVEDGVVKIKV